MPGWETNPSYLVSTSHLQIYQVESIIYVDESNLMQVRSIDNLT